MLGRGGNAGDRHFGDTPPRRGPDLTCEICLSRDEAADRAVIPVRRTAHKACPACATREDEQTARACTTCRGQGQIIHEQRTHQVRIPAGIREGQRIRLRELGGPGQHGGAPGDLYVTVHIDDW
ncbi:DnaJ C-terminal domain-containing protein [Streptomyces chrestomyceticus]|uniref:DnaJ C-terminal domain-containing protein n=1 Tax=Streptomyces chrestomyceticus TaxID=68185 RepID=A0ABU7X656_9ACTN